jgi:hypothetical protein
MNARVITLAVVVPVVAIVHVLVAAVLIRHSNQDSHASDQGAEMWLAATAREDLLPQRTDGVRHPLFSWVVRGFYVEDPGAFFVRGKWFNTALAVGFLVVLGVACSRWLDPVATANLLLLSSWGILLVRATYFQPEPIYYMAFFAACVLAVRVLAGAKFREWVLLGLVCAVAYLAKPSLMPFLGIFAVAVGVRAVWSLRGGDGSWPVGRNLAGAGVAAVLVVVSLIPLARYGAEHFGKPLFNFTTLWMWFDDFETEAWPFQTKHPARPQLAAVPPDEMPSLAWYFRRHTLGDAVARGLGGTANVVVRFFWPEQKSSWREFFWKDAKKWEQPLSHRGVYILVLGGVVIFGLVVAVRCGGAGLWRAGVVVPVGFCVAVVGAYACLYGWYWPIGRGDRFMGSLWIPIIFGLIWAGHALVGGSRVYRVVHGAVLASLVLQIASAFWLFSQGVFLVTRN